MKTPHILLAALILSAAPLSHAENWPQWRGPHSNHTAPANPAYPTEFSADKNLLWRVELPGKASSTPAVWEDKIFLTSPDAGNDSALAYDFKGNLLWQTTFGKEVPGKHRNGSGSNPSPVTDGKHVVVYYKSGTLACLSAADGTEIWKTNLQEKFGRDTLWWDLGTSPILVDGKAVVAVMHEGESYVAAFDLPTGELAWKVDRTFELPKETDQSYTTPFLFEHDGGVDIVIWGADHVTGHDPKTGETRWFTGGFNPKNEAMWRVIASPGVAKDIAVVPYGRAKNVRAVKLGGKGDTTATAELWNRSDFGTDCPSPIVFGDSVLVHADNGELACMDLKTGADRWQDRWPRDASKFFASPALAGNLLYANREDGSVLVGEITEAGFKFLSENKLDEALVASPVPVNGHLLIRGSKHLYCFTKK